MHTIDDWSYAAETSCNLLLKILLCTVYCMPKINLLVRCLSHNFLLKFVHPIQAMQYRNVYTATRQNSQQFSSSSSPSQSTMPLHLHVALTHTWGWEGQYTSQPYSKAVAFVRQGLSVAGMRWQQTVSAYLQVHVIRTVMHLMYINTCICVYKQCSPWRCLCIAICNDVE